MRRAGALVSSECDRAIERQRGGLRRKVNLWRVGANDSGQNLVEFALILPLMILMLMGVVEFGRGVNAFITLSEAAREGARAGIYTSSTDDDIRAAVRSQSGALGTVSDGDIVISPTFPRQPGQSVSVTVVYRLAAITPILDSILGGNTLTLRGQAKMRVE